MINLKVLFHLLFRPGVQFATLDVDDVSNAGLDADFPNETVLG